MAQNCMRKEKQLQLVVNIPLGIQMGRKMEVAWVPSTPNKLSVSTSVVSVVIRWDQQQNVVIQQRWAKVHPPLD